MASMASVLVLVMVTLICDFQLASSAFDCATHAETWQVAWSTSKAFWCCRHEHKGCSSRKSLTLPHFCHASPLSWEKIREDGGTMWCCRRKHGACVRKLATLPYACDVDLVEWKTAWSDKKKLWCCVNECRGCPLSFPCSPKLLEVNDSFAQRSLPYRHGHQEAFSVEYIFEVGFTIIFFIAAMHFMKKGCSYHYHGNGSSSCAEECAPLRRTMKFHVLAGIAALAMAYTHALKASGSNNLLWSRYGGRVATSACLAVALGYVHGGQMMDIFPALALAAGAWGQIGIASATSVEPGVYYGLCLSGIFMGSVAFHIIYSFEHRFRAPLPDPEPRRWMVDLSLFCNVGYLLQWFIFELKQSDESAAATPVLVAILNGFIDIVYGWGVCRMLTKREHLIDKVTSLNENGYWRDVTL